MTRFILHDLRAPAPGEPCASAVAPGGGRFAWFTGSAALDADALHALATPEPRRVVLWSGSMGESRFDRTPLTWMPAGRDAFERACERLAAGADAASVSVLLRPHARHALSDAPTCRAWLDRWAGGPLGLLFDPASMFEAGMLPDGADHLPRLFEALAPRCAAALLASAEPAPDDDDPPRLVPLSQGLLDAAQLAALAREFLPAQTPVVTLTPACHTHL